jgi:hypothetical protein
MLGMGAVIVCHVPPAAKVAGVPARYLGPNVEGLRRWDVPPGVQHELCTLLQPEVTRSDRTTDAFSLWNAYEKSIDRMGQARERLQLTSECC